MAAEEFEEDQDQDSLFGSPPPSPRLSGRTGSPALALPSATSTQVASINAHLLANGNQKQGETAEKQKNVGTIALPGSQIDSELPIHPLALSLSHGVVQRPPALLIQKKPQQQLGDVQAKLGVVNQTTPADATNSSSSPVPMSRRVGKTTGKDKTSKKRQRPSATPSQSSSRSGSSHPEISTTVPPPLEFSLPDPTGPPPTHFLRNQENLLGKAGRVAGVKPTTLAHMRGSTPANPIYIDDDDDNNRDKKKSKSQYPPLSNEEIVSVLIAQKDIFPVLESLLHLLAKGAGGGQKAVVGPRFTGFESRLSFASNTSISPPPPPLKKRKLTHVPAGAADWDVPFPFEEGEGPEYYKETWEKERGRHLVNELVKMIKGAVGKVLARKGVSVAVEKGIGKLKGASKVEVRDTMLKGHYRPETAKYGQIKAEDITGNHHASITSPPVPSATAPSTHTLVELQTPPTPAHIQPTYSLDQLLTPIIDVDLPSSIATPSSSTFASGSNFFPAELATSIPPLQTHVLTESQYPPAANPSLPDDQTMFDTWMNFLEAFPITFDFDSGASRASEPSSTSVLSDGTSTPTTMTATPTPTTVTPTMSLPSTPTPALEASDLSIDFDTFFKNLLNVPGVELLEPEGSGSSTCNTTNVSSQDDSRSFDSFGLDVGSDVLALTSLSSATTATAGGIAGIGIEESDHLIDPALLAISSTMNTNISASSSVPGVGWGGSEMVGGDASGGLGGLSVGQDGLHGGSLSISIPMDVDEALGSFGLDLPDLTNMDDRLQRHNSTIDLKGKGKEVAVNTSIDMTAPLVSISNLTPGQLDSLTQNALDSLLGMQAKFTSCPTLTSTYLSLHQSAPSNNSVQPSLIAAAAASSREARHQRKEDIVNRAKDRREKIQEELNVVKRRLWETTIEKAGLLLIAKELGNGDVQK